MNSSPSGPKQEAGDKILYWGGDEVHNPPRHHSSEVSTSGDELVKVRKPYTITKQRERWTEEEHEKFLEALKLHGRAWRRIEEHIGTKTAVQIRSHAQKFFSKLEREQAAGGILPGTIQDIDIPPPRPKRKPSHPYPRKAADAAMASPAAIQSPSAPAPAPALEHGEPGKGLERSKSELKLFGQTVVVPTATRAVAAPDHGVEIGEASRVEELSPELKIDPEHGQVGPFVGSEELHQHQQQPPHGVDLSAVYYSKVWERFAETMYPFGVEGGGSLWPFQYHRSGVPPGCWPSFSPTSLNDITSSVMRAIMAGSHPSAHHMSESSSAALAAATVAAASAWWALQGSVPPGFVPNTASGAPPEAGGNPGEEPASEDLEKGVVEVEMDDECLKLSPSGSIKRGTLESQEAGRKRARVRSSVGSSGALEKQESEVIKCYAPPPSSSGSDDGVGNAELQLNGDGDASGNSGPSSNSSRCGTVEAAGKTDDSSSDKDRNEEEKVALEEAAKALKASAGFSHHHSHLFRNRKVPQQRAARPSRSSGSDGEQRKEVSQEGRMAFQALFSHQKLPQTFTTKVGGEVRKSLSEDNIVNILSSCEFSNRYSCDKSPNTTTSSLKISGFECMESESSPVKSKASDEDGGETGEEMSLATSKSSRRSGFVPYRRAAADVVAVTPTSCKAEENRLGATRPLIDDEVKA